MTSRAAAVLFAALAVSPASAARVELVPETVIPAAPSAAAASLAPVPLALSPSHLAASAPLSAAPAFLPASALQAALPAVAAAPAPAPGLIAAAAVPAPALALAKPPASRGDASRPTLLQTVSAPMPDVSKLSGGESAAAAEKDFAARAQLDAPAAGGGGLVETPVREPAPRSLHLVKPAAPLSSSAQEMESTLIPAWMKEELPIAAAKLGRPLPAEYAADVLARSNVWAYKWHSRWTYEIAGGLPDGHYDPKFGIRVMLKTDWRKLKDPQTHFRVLYAHEYTHWLQEEGLVTRRYGGETPAVAVEQLRGMELVGWEGLKEGRVGFIAEGNLQSFESGRKWARGDMMDESQLYFRGVLGGAAYEVGLIAGRPEAAWEFLNLVIAEKGGLAPREAFERVTGLKK
jgi:hypothetical protein